MTADEFYGFEQPYKGTHESRPLYLGICRAYTILNFTGMRPDDRLSNPHRTAAIMSDASHVGHAAYCQVLVSADRALCIKADAIYRYKGLQTQVLPLS